VGAWDFPERSHAAKLMLGFPVKTVLLVDRLSAETCSPVSDNLRVQALL